MTKKADQVPVVTTLSDSEALTVLTASGVKQIKFEDLKSLVRESLVIGGRNYLANSEGEIGLTIGDSGAEFISKAGFSEAVELAGGPGKFMLSFEAKSVGVPGQVQVYAYQSDTGKYEISAFVISATNEWQRFTREINVKVKNPDGIMKPLAFYGGKNSGIIPHVRKIKLEKGNVATDWSPAPEDFGGGSKSRAISALCGWRCNLAFERKEVAA